MENKIKQIRLLCRTANTYGHHKTKTGFDLHNLRLDNLEPEQKNYIPEDSHKNQIFRNNILVPQNDFEDLIAEIEQDHKDNVKASKNGLSDDRLKELNLARSRTKTKFFKWSEVDDIQESAFFTELVEATGKEKIDADAKIEELKSLGKIKRLNDKVKAIKKMAECNDLLDVVENNSMSLKVVSSEKLFKIPDQWETEIKAEDWNNIVNDIHNKCYPNYKAYYTAIHLDEKSSHAHHRISGFNQKTKAFDLPDHELNLIRRLWKKPDLFENKKWSELNNKELKQFGELYQNAMFNLCNSRLKKLGYDVKAVKRTPEEVATDNHIYSNSKIRNRVFNGANKLKEELKSWFENITKDLKKSVNIHLEIEKKHGAAGVALHEEVKEILNKDKQEEYKSKYTFQKNRPKY